MSGRCPCCTFATFFREPEVKSKVLLSRTGRGELVLQLLGPDSGLVLPVSVPPMQSRISRKKQNKHLFLDISRPAKSTSFSLSRVSTAEGPSSLRFPNNLFNIVAHSLLLPEYFEKLCALLLRTFTPTLLACTIDTALCCHS